MHDGLRFGVIYSVTLVQLHVITASTFSADFDEDGDVDANDLTSWKMGFGGTDPTHGQGDADRDHDVDGIDFLAWQQRLGSGAIVDVIRAVPEPSGPIIALATFCCHAAAARRFVCRDLQRHGHQPRR